MPGDFLRRREIQLREEDKKMPAGDPNAGKELVGKPDADVKDSKYFNESYGMYPDDDLQLSPKEILVLKEGVGLMGNKLLHLQSINEPIHDPLVRKQEYAVHRKVLKRWSSIKLMRRLLFPIVHEIYNLPLTQALFDEYNERVQKGEITI